MKYPNTNDDLNDFIECVSLGMDIELKYKDTGYWIGRIDGKIILSEFYSNQDTFFDTVDDLLNYQIDGQLLRDIVIA
ncbi:hypothetical protein [Lactococcus sp.]|uniref:hypothetical protein n=1 Tax=Lactococcus sp. TaxID=44273 RepID=UPI0035B04DCB